VTLFPADSAQRRKWPKSAPMFWWRVEVLATSRLMNNVKDEGHARRSGSPLAKTLAVASRRRLAHQRKGPVSGAFYGADDGTRTHDLLHGKQTL
jgi:hypothetical protein